MGVRVGGQGGGVKQFEGQLLLPPLLIVYAFFTACMGCNEGQRRCVGTSIYQCCNWYLNNTCINTCPFPLTGSNDTFDCGEL